MDEPKKSKRLIIWNGGSMLQKQKYCFNNHVWLIKFYKNTLGLQSILINLKKH